MPHFVLECSHTILESHTQEHVIERVHSAAHATALFAEDDIKVRVVPFAVYAVGNKRTDFIHVFASIMEGRTVEQKAHLSKVVVAELVAMFPDVEFIAMNVAEFERATYCNKSMLGNTPTH